MALNGSSCRPLMDESEIPKPHRQSTIGSLARLLLALGVVLAVVFVPSIRVHLKTLFPPMTSPKPNPAVVVWAHKQAGNYYCAGSRLYGKQPGNFMKQGDALTLGFQPALGGYCQKAK